jgi:hypothetical protein
MRLGKALKYVNAVFVPLRTRRLADLSQDFSGCPSPSKDVLAASAADTKIGNWFRRFMGCASNDPRGSLEFIDALSANWSSFKSELAAVSGLTLTAYPGSTKETEAAELFQNLPTGIFRLRAQPPVSVLSGNKLGANYRRRDCAGTWTSFVRANPEPYRFQYGVRRSELGNKSW